MAVTEKVAELPGMTLRGWGWAVMVGGKRTMRRDQALVELPPELRTMVRYSASSPVVRLARLSVAVAAEGFWPEKIQLMLLRRCCQ